MSTPEPRTRATRLKRDPKRVKRFKAHVGDETMTETCPRCGWPCTHLVRAYYDSPWNAHGGICLLCCLDAEMRFDRDGWPPHPLDAEPEVERAVEPPKVPELFDP